MGAERVQLRGFCKDDLNDFVSWHRTLKTGYSSKDERHARQAFDEILQRTASGAPASRAIAPPGIQRAIGQAGIVPDYEDGMAAIAFLIDEPFWGLEYATGAAGRLIEKRNVEHPDRRLVASNSGRTSCIGASSPEARLWDGGHGAAGRD
jgi:RimJ/RimL family protein N-acetyltransferase